MELASECVAQKDFVTLLTHIDDVMETNPTPSLLYERALCIGAIPAFSTADKIAALSEYVAQNPLDARWIAHALYMMSAYYLDLHQYPDSARMRFLADECEFLREQNGTFPPIDIDGAFPQKAEVEIAFTPPSLVISNDEQHESIKSGSLPCYSCPPNAAPVPLLNYVEHRTTLCPGKTTTQPSDKSGK